MTTTRITGRTPEEVAQKAAAMGIHIDPAKLQADMLQQKEAEKTAFAFLREQHGYTEDDLSILRLAYQVSGTLTPVALDPALHELVAKHDNLPAAKCRAAIFDCIHTLRTAVNRAALLTSKQDGDLMGEIAESTRYFLRDAAEAASDLQRLQAKADLVKEAGR